MFTGSCVALVTPMTEEGAVDYNCVRALIEWHIEQGTQALVIAGTTGESATLSHEEWALLLQIAVETAAGRLPIIAGTGSNSTQKTIENTQKAKDLGCMGALVVTPYYNRPTQEGLYQHYAALAKAVALPVILYNVPTRTGCDLLPETAARLSHLKHIVGIKEATGDVSRVSKLMELCEHPFKLFTGEDSNTVDFIKAGGHGGISVVANIVPKEFQKMCELALKGQIELARKAESHFKELYKHLFIEPNPIPVKWAMQKLGLIPSGIRLPLTPLSEQYQSRLNDILQHVGAAHA